MAGEWKLDASHAPCLASLTPPLRQNGAGNACTIASCGTTALKRPWASPAPPE